jgi:hypothetical protein
MNGETCQKRKNERQVNQARVEAAGARGERTSSGKREPAPAVRVFYDNGARPPRPMTLSFIDTHREELGDRAELPRTGAKLSSIRWWQRRRTKP